jgi:gas vesicle protein
MNTNGKILLGFLLGTTIGTATGMLMAPATGLRTRKNLNKKAKKMVKQFEALIGKTKTRKVSSAGSHVRNGKATVSAR